MTLKPEVAEALECGKESFDEYAEDRAKCQRVTGHNGDHMSIEGPTRWTNTQDPAWIAHLAAIKKRRAVRTEAEVHGTESDVEHEEL